MRKNRSGIASLALAAAAAWIGLQSPARAEAVPQLRLAIQYGIAYLPAMIAGSQGLFAEAAKAEGLPGLDVTIRHLSSSTPINDALLSGDIDIGWLGPPGLLLMWDKTYGGLGVRGVSGLSTNIFTFVTTNPAIKTLKDIGPKDRIAVTTIIGTQAFVLRMAAEQIYGPGQEKHFETQMVTLAHPDAVAALLSGSEVNAYFGTPPFIDFVKKDPRVHTVLTSRDIVGGPVPSAGPAATKRFVDANPKIVRAFVAGLKKAVAFIAADPKRAAELYLKEEPQKMSADEVAALLVDPANAYSVEPTRYMLFADFMARTGLLKRKAESWRDLFFAPISDGEGS